MDIPTYEVVRTGENTVEFLHPCPFCGKKHRHGLGGGDLPSHRAAHCGSRWKGRTELPDPPNRPSGYWLAWAEGEG